MGQVRDFVIGRRPFSQQILRGAFFGLGLSAGFYLGVQCLPDQDFTEQEKDTLTQLFKDSIDIDDINFNRSPAGEFVLNAFNASGTTIGNTVIMRQYMPRHSAYYNYVLVHEAAHIWQSQNCHTNFFSNTFDEAVHFFDDAAEIYKYHLDADKDLLDYNHEAQASIIADYYNFQAGKSTDFDQNEYTSPTKKDALYKAVLSNFIQDPKYIRQHCI